MWQTAVSRYILTVTIFVPSMLLYLIERMKVMPKNFGIRTTLEMSLFFLELYMAVPLAIATASSRPLGRGASIGLPRGGGAISGQAV